ncbi:hypothetical protein EXIGLDRAFT_184688 [Exidia glandulosa HHB12029]|uniref:Uncharacterized protein n=1 Tax=Exidia glandulosa HHB12029 TaxID=1314781 RepID=A0A165F0X0_EXIGL|nr:hypothetical protein EXIGLDRAFT_184688 [Exidia glandulosa HHB12029]
MWKILIFALRLREEDASFEVVGDICIYPTRTRIPFGEPMNDMVLVQLPAPGTAQGGRRQSRISRVWSNVGATWRRRSIRGPHAAP